MLLSMPLLLLMPIPLLLLPLLMMIMMMVMMLPIGLTFDAGKTLLAKATAGEAKVPFFTVSGKKNQKFTVLFI